MRKTLIAMIAILPVLVALALDPAKITMTNFRGEAVSAADAGTFYRGDVIIFTNCVVYSGSDTSTAVENLTGLTLTVTHGDQLAGSTSTVATGTVQVATSGTWNATTRLATNEAEKTYSTFIQIRLTDGTNTYTYPFKTLTVKSAL